MLKIHVALDPQLTAPCGTKPRSYFIKLPESYRQDLENLAKTLGVTPEETLHYALALGLELASSP